MSVDLHVVMDDEISISDIITGAYEEVKKLTGINNIRPISLDNWSKVDLTPEDKDLSHKCSGVGIITFLGYGEIIELFALEVDFKRYNDISFIPKKDMGYSYRVSVMGHWEIKYLLAAGVILAIAKISKRPIYDETQFWVPRRISSYDEFFNDVRIDGIVSKGFKEHWGIQALSEIFYNRLASPTKYRDMEKEKEGT